MNKQVEQIKAEIERRKSLSDRQKNNGYFFARSDAYAELLNFIDSMPEEPVSDDLEEEIQRYKDSHDYMSEYIRKVARYFALWGKIHLKDPVCKVLEEAATRAAYHQYQDREKDYISENEKKKFIEGAQWQKQQMMKIAATATIRFGKIEISKNELEKALIPFFSGDKVKIIIIEEDKI